MTSKWMLPSFLVATITMIAVACNNRFGWHLNPTQLVASIGLSVNFVVVAIVNDIAKMKKGEPINWGSTKLFTLIFACLIIGFASYLDIELSHEEIWYIAGAAATYISGRGIKDIIQTKGANTNEPTQYHTGGGPAV